MGETSVSALVFNLSSEASVGRKDPFYLLTRAVGPLGRSRGMLAGLLARRVDSLVATSGGALEAPPKTYASSRTCESLLPNC